MGYDGLIPPHWNLLVRWKFKFLILVLFPTQQAAQVHPQQATDQHHSIRKERALCHHPRCKHCAIDRKEEMMRFELAHEGVQCLVDEYVNHGESHRLER